MTGCFQLLWLKTAIFTLVKIIYKKPFRKKLVTCEDDF